MVNYDDEIAELLVRRNQTEFSEADGSGEITVSLTRRPEDDVVVDITCTDPYKALLSTMDDPLQEEVSLVFTTENWNDPQWVALTGQDNEFADGDHVFGIAVSVNPIITLDRSGYLDANTQMVDITVRDNESSGATVYLSRYCAALEYMEE